MVQKDIKIKWYMIFSFLVILVVMIALGCSSFYYTQRLANQTIEFYESPHVVQLNVSEVRRDMADIGSALKEAMLYRDPTHTQTSKTKVNALLADMTERITLVKNRFTGDQQLLNDADVIVADWLASGESLQQLLMNGSYEQASNDFENIYMPLEEKLGQSVQKISDYSGTVTEEFYATAKRSKAISAGVILGSILLAVALTIYVCSSVVKSIMIPLQQVKEAADAISKGNLDYPIPFTGKNEFGQLAESMRVTTKTLSSYIGNISDALSRMANNDMTVSIDMDYVGDFAPIKEALGLIAQSLSQALEQMGEVAEQVAVGAQQVASSAQVLSQGASEQANSLEELSANVAQISSQVRQNTDYTEQTNVLVRTVGDELERGNVQMKQMLTAISEINVASDQIAKIIKTIEDIAFQTNILALNAAVEAARAGSAGKGFAVVADEVRNLAGKSADAAKSTTALIQNSIQAVKHGTQIATSTAQALAAVVDGASQITTMVEKIATASEGQSASLGQVNQAVSLISGVVQTNSATSEESAAASEELQGQAQVLESLMRRFKIRSDLPPMRQADVYSQPSQWSTPRGYSIGSGSKY